MAIIWIEGWEEFGLSNGNAAGVTSKYTKSGTGSGTTDVIVDGRLSPSKALRIRATSGVDRLDTPQLGTKTTMTMGAAFKISSSTRNAEILAFMENDGTVGMNLQVLTAGTIRIRRGGTDIALTGALISLDTWYYIEMSCVAGNTTTGSYEVKLDGTTVLSDATEDTLAGGATTGWTQVRLYGDIGNGSQIHWDDYYIADDATFRGSHQVYTIFPTSDVGTPGFTPSAGSNFENVDEAGHDTDTTYNESDGTVGHRDDFGFGNLPGAADITAIQVNVVARKTADTDFNIEIPVVSNAVESAGSTYAINSGSYMTAYRVLEEDPDTTAAWLSAAVDAVQAGYEVVA